MFFFFSTPELTLERNNVHFTESITFADSIHQR